MPTVVLLHGVGLDAGMWEPVATRLRRQGRTVLTPTLPGHGGDRSTAGGTSLASLSAAVAESVPGGSHLVGFSLGALIAQHLACRRPELVATLTLVSSVCERTPQERAAVRERLVAAEHDFEGSVVASIERWFPADGDGRLPVPEETVEQVRRVLLANDPASYLACYRVFAEADAAIASELGGILAPTVAVTGSRDTGSTAAMSVRLSELIPHCTARIVNGARHMVPLERPDDIAGAITTIIEEHH